MHENRFEERISFSSRDGLTLAAALVIAWTQTTSCIAIVGAWGPTPTVYCDFSRFSFHVPIRGSEFFDHYRINWTWQLAQLFKIEKGKIRRIEAVFHQAPFGIPSGWSTYEQSISEEIQSVR